MKISSLFLIAAGVIALGAVTAALEIEIVKRDIAAPEDESKLLAEDPAGEASLLAQLTGWLAQLTRREAEAGGIGFGAADAAGGSDNGAAGGSDYGAAGAAGGSDYVAAGGSYYSEADGSKLLAEEIAGEASLLAQLTRREAEGKDCQAHKGRHLVEQRYQKVSIRNG